MQPLAFQEGVLGGIQLFGQIKYSLARYRELDLSAPLKLTLVREIDSSDGDS